jgi:hypothetical protein
MKALRRSMYGISDELVPEEGLDSVDYQRRTSEGAELCWPRLVHARPSPAGRAGGVGARSAVASRLAIPSIRLPL